MNNQSQGASKDEKRALFLTRRQRSVTTLLAALVLFTLVGCASLVRPNFETEVVKLRPGNYTLDPDHTFVLFRVDHLNLSQVIGRFNEVEANLEFDPNDLAAMRLDGRIATASIDINNPSFESDLRGSGWLASDTYPNATFITEAVTVGEDDSLTIDGQFTLRGITQPLSLDAKFNGGADNILTGKYTLGFTAFGSVSRKAYGVDSFAALVGDTIEIEIQAEFQQQ